MEWTMITAHAGAENTPANALEGIRALCAVGADAIEMDVRDIGGQLVLSHDARAEAAGLTTLADALREVAKHDGLKVNLDLKHFGLTRAVAGQAQAFGLLDRTILTGDVSDEEIAFACAAGIEVWCNDSLLPAGADPLDGPADKGLEVANLDRSTAARCLARGPRRLSVWTVDDPAELAMFLRAGVRNVTTREPALALRMRAALRPSDGEAVAAFHRDWDEFPGPARLVGGDHIVRAANGAARRAGFVEGATCAAVPTANRHRGCLLAQAVGADARARFDISGGMARGWLPVAGRNDLTVHFSLRMPPEDAR